MNEENQNQFNSNQNLNNQPQPTDYPNPVYPSAQTDFPNHFNNQAQAPINDYSFSRPADNLPKFEEKTSKNKRSGGLFFKFLAITTIFILLIVSGLLVFILTNPKNEASKYIVKNSFLNGVVDLPSDNTNSSSSSSEAKLINNIIGGTQSSSPTNGNLTFVNPGDSKTVVQVIEDSLPSVLSISLSTKGENGLNQVITAGTGYIVSADGIVVSNRHVVQVICKSTDNQIQINALGHDQKTYTLSLLSIDPVDDISILKINNPPAGLKPVKVVNSDSLKVGQDVLAIGNVLGELQNTVTKGIISGLNRNFQTALKDDCTGTDFQADNLIQTDAAINRGNSGGPMFNSSGELVGMNTLGTTDAQNIGLALPSSAIKTALDSFIANNRVVRARLGVTTQPINSIFKAQNTWLPTDSGEIISTATGKGTAVAKNSAAELAGLKDGDIILEVDGVKLVSSDLNPSPIRRAVLSRQAGVKTTLTVLKVTTRSSSGFSYEASPKTVEVTLGSIYFDLPSKKLIAN